ncbi:hypothetical protein PWP93_36400 [Paraburkholderia sp. A1RI-2L]|uniref:hypothetical protein n=1 Tax=Paraburkholderia sp. A1RI-2L TaxID=3028367 RepID=UPI003B777F4D
MAVDDPFGNTDINNARVGMGLPLSADTVDSWYFGTYTGPQFDINGTLYNTYFGACALSPTGSVDGVQLTPSYPSNYSAN